jgi:hypothetical protein
VKSLGSTDYVLESKDGEGRSATGMSY